MSTPSLWDAARSAVLSMDLQIGIVSMYAKDDPTFLERVARVLKQARTSGSTVIHVRVGFRSNLPEVSSRNLLLDAIRNSAQHRQLFEGPAGEIHPAVAPQQDDITVVKHRVGAFPGTDLDMILRAKDIDTLVLMGISTSGVVLSTLLHAADADYRLIVLKDCCCDLDTRVHECLMDRVFPRQARVISSSAFLEM